MTNGMMLLATGHALHIWSTILPPMNSYARWNKVTKIWKILSSISSWVNAWHVGRETEGIMKKKVMWPIYPLGSTVGTLYKPVRHYTCVSTMFFIYNTPLEDDLRTTLTNSGCTRLQRPFKWYNMSGIMLEAIEYRPWAWSMLILPINSCRMYTNITKTCNNFLFVVVLWFITISSGP